MKLIKLTPKLRNHSKNFNPSWSVWTAPHPATGSRDFIVGFENSNEKFELEITEGDIQNLLDRKRRS